jgi:L-aminopeptidase/D-esterase-like protein
MVKRIEHHDEIEGVIGEGQGFRCACFKSGVGSSSASFVYGLRVGIDTGYPCTFASKLSRKSSLAAPNIENAQALELVDGAANDGEGTIDCGVAHL